MTIGVISPESGNITSICDALERLNRSARILETPQLDGIKQLLLPGQGRFAPVMNYLNESGWSEILAKWLEDDRPFLGICVGMQVLFDSSDEDPGTRGLGFFRGHVTTLNAPKRPMIGWAKVSWEEPGFTNGAAYFVNSYVVKGHSAQVATSTYGETFSAAVRRKNVFAFQFHPEKSGIWGKEVLEQCLVY